MHPLEIPKNIVYFDDSNIGYHTAQERSQSSRASGKKPHAFDRNSRVNESRLPLWKVNATLTNFLCTFLAVNEESISD